HSAVVAAQAAVGSDVDHGEGRRRPRAARGALGVIDVAAGRIDPGGLRARRGAGQRGHRRARAGHLHRGDAAARGARADRNRAADRPRAGGLLAVGLAVAVVVAAVVADRLHRLGDAAVDRAAAAAALARRAEGIAGLRRTVAVGAIGGAVAVVVDAVAAADLDRLGRATVGSAPARGRRAAHLIGAAGERVAA